MPAEIKSNLIHEDTLKLLKKFQILRELSENDILLLLGKKKNSDYQKRIARLLRFDKEEIVIREGDFDCWVFWVVQGEFAVIKNDVVVAIFDVPGIIFGEMSFLDEDKRSASVVAVTKGICLSIDMSVLDTIMDDNLKFTVMSGIQHLKSRRLNKTTQKLAAEKQKVTLEQKKILEDRLKLEARERVLVSKEVELSKREIELEKRLAELSSVETDDPGSVIIS